MSGKRKEHEKVKYLAMLVIPLFCDRLHLLLEIPVVLVVVVGDKQRQKAADLARYLRFANAAGGSVDRRDDLFYAIAMKDMTYKSVPLSTKTAATLEQTHHRARRQLEQPWAYQARMGKSR